MPAPRSYVLFADGTMLEATLPDIVKVLADGITALPLKLARPVTFNALFTVVLPEEAPRVRLAADEPM